MKHAVPGLSGTACGAIAPGDVASAFERDQLQALYANSSSGLAASAIFAGVTAAAHWPVVSHAVLIAWCAGIALLTAARAVLNARFQRSAGPAQPVSPWFARHFAGVVVSGAVWGAAGVLFFTPESVAHQAFLALTLCGLTAGAVPMFSASRATFLGFALPNCLPMIVRLFLMGDGLHLWMGTAAVIFLGIMTRLVWILNRGQLKTFELIANLKSAESALQKSHEDLGRQVGERTVELQQAVELLRNEVAERKRIETALLKSEERFRVLFDRSPIPIVLSDLADGRIVEANNAVYATFGYEHGEVVGRTSRDLNVWTSDEDRLRLIHVIQEQGHVTGAATMRQRNGELIHIVYSGNKIEVDGRDFALGSLVDVTARKRAEAALQESEEHFRALTEHSQDLITILDADGNIRYQGGATESLLGYPQGELVGQKAIDYVHPEDLPTVAQRMQLLIRGNLETHGTQYRFRRKDGTWRAIESIGTNLLHHPAVRGIVINSRDVTEREQHETQFRLFRSLIDHSSDAIFVVDPVTARFLDINDSACANLGYTREELLALTVMDIETNFRDLAAFEHDKQRLKAAGTIRFEGGQRRKDGSTIPVEVNVRYISLPHGDYCLAIARDITERKRIEEERRAATEELLRSEERFSKLFFASPFSILLATVPEGRILDVNPAFLSLFGFERHEVIGKTTTELNLWSDPADRLKMLEGLRKDAAVRNMECSFQRKSGQRRTLLLSIEIIQLNGQPHSLAMSIDITERKQAEDAISRSEARNRGILSAIPDMMFRLSRDGVFLDYQAQPTDALYAQPENFLGRNIREIMPPEFAGLTMQNIAAVPESGGIRRFEYSLPVPAGLHHFEARLAASGADEVVAIVRDITERKQAELLTQASLREKETLLREIHHRVKNNLQIISSLLHFQSKKAASEQERTVFHEGQDRLRAMILVHDKLYRSDDLYRISLAEYLRSLTDQLQRSFSGIAGRIQLKLQAEEVRLPVEIALPCGMIVTELVTNAFKYAYPARQKGSVLVRIARRESSFLLSVADTGCGLPAGFDLARTSSFGLQLVTRLAAQLGAVLTLPPGSGTMICVEVPLPAEPATLEEPVTAPPPVPDGQWPLPFPDS
jgi:PAS domain S-box-containing protein